MSAENTTAYCSFLLCTLFAVNWYRPLRGVTPKVREIHGLGPSRAAIVSARSNRRSIQWVETPTQNGSFSTPKPSRLISEGQPGKLGDFWDRPERYATSWQVSSHARKDQDITCSRGAPNKYDPSSRRKHSQLKRYVERYSRPPAVMSAKGPYFSNRSYQTNFEPLTPAVQRKKLN